jgi:hypothetical protein
MSVPRAVPPRDLQSLKLAIRARAREFEIAPLLDLLATLGYRPSDIYFCGNLTETPQPTLLHRIEFAGLEPSMSDPTSRDPAVALGNLAELAAEAPAGLAGVADDAGGAARARGGDDDRFGGGLPIPAPHRRPRDQPQVTVTVNLGLLSCRSPLPSYFQHLLRDAAINEPLVELLQILDRNLLRTRLTCDRPERIVAQWDEISNDLLRIFSLDSLVGLRWLFRHVFPELPVAVKRTSEQLRVRYAPARLGSSELGSACFGAVTQIDVHDFQVTLRCDDSLARAGVPWLHEVDRRLRTTVFPALEPVCMNLTIMLELQDDSAAAQLRDDRTPLRNSYLGQDPLGRPSATDAPARRVILYHGLLPHDHPDTDELERALAAHAHATVTAGDDRGATAGGSATPTEPETAVALALVLELGGQLHRYHAVVRWGARAWFRDDPYTIELRCYHVPQLAPTSRHHPQLWSLLRDQARHLLTTALATTTLASYGVATVTDAMVADLIARDQQAALHALLTGRGAHDMPGPAWARLVHGTT